MLNSYHDVYERSCVRNDMMTSKLISALYRQSKHFKIQVLRNNYYTNFVWLEALTMLINNPINIILINPNIILYYVFS